MSPSEVTEMLKMIITDQDQILTDITLGTTIILEATQKMTRGTRMEHSGTE